MKLTPHKNILCLHYKDQLDLTALITVYSCGDRIPVGVKFSAPVQTGPGAHPASYTMGTTSVSRGVKRPERGANQPSPFSAKVKERVELYRYFLPGPSCHVVGRSETNRCLFIELYETLTVVCVSVVQEVVHVKY